MSIHSFTMFKCKNLMTEISVDLSNILFIEKLRSGNCKLHFSGHEEITVQESYDSVAAILSPAPLTVKATKRDISSIESIGIGMSAIGNPDDKRHAHPQRPRGRSKGVGNGDDE